MRDNNLVHQQIAKVEIRTFHYATRLAGHEPKTLDEFSYGIAFPVATMIVRGQLGPNELTLETLNDPDILRISRATKLIDDAELTARSVEKRWSAVSLTTMDGQRFEAPPRTPRGDTDQPLSDENISNKFHLFADDVIGKNNSKQLHDMASSFDTLSANEFKNLITLCCGD